jgi:molecular chaperone Hsp33
MDRMVTATAADGNISLVAGVTTGLVRETCTRHDLSPSASAAVGRLISGAALLGASLKGRERLMLQIASGGPIGGIVAESMTLGDGTVGARAYAKRPKADVPLNARGKFDVATLVGSGTFHVTKSYEVGQAYNGIVPVVSGEIGEDLAYYLRHSQQIPSIVALGVLANPSGVIAAGGIIAQVLPGADESVIADLEAQANAMPPITTLINAGASADDVIATLTGGLGIKRMREFDVRFACRCTREKVEAALIGLGRDELLKIASEQPRTEATCEFCKEVYVLSADEVSDLARSIESG